MGVKKINRFQFNWSASQNFPYNQNLPLSGVTNGVMSGTNTIYSNVQNVQNFDNLGLIVNYVGTASGTILIMGSNYPDLGEPWCPLTFTPPITQPSGSSGFYGIDLNNFPWYYLQVQYTNASGSGILTVSIAQKDVN